VKFEVSFRLVRQIRGGLKGRGKGDQGRKCDSYLLRITWVLPGKKAEGKKRGLDAKKKYAWDVIFTNLSTKGGTAKKKGDGLVSAFTGEKGGKGGGEGKKCFPSPNPKKERTINGKGRREGRGEEGRSSED